MKTDTVYQANSFPTANNTDKGEKATWGIIQLWFKADSSRRSPTHRDGTFILFLHCTAQPPGSELLAPAFQEVAGVWVCLLVHNIFSIADNSAIPHDNAAHFTAN